MKPLLWLAVSFPSWMASPPAWADTIRFGISSFPPFYVVDGDKVSGSLIPVLDELAMRSGRSAEVVNLPINRLREALGTGEVDAWLTGSQPSLAAETFRTRSLGRLTIRAYWLPGTPPIGRAKDLSGRKIITILGYQYAGIEAIAELTHSADNFSARSHRDGLAMLAQSHGDYLLDYEQPTSASRADLNVRTMESVELFGTAVVIYVSRRAGGGAGLYDQLDKAAQDYLADHGPISGVDGDSHASLGPRSRLAAD